MGPNGNRTMNDNYQFINVIGICENDIRNFGYFGAAGAF